MVFGGILWRAVVQLSTLPPWFAFASVGILGGCSKGGEQGVVGFGYRLRFLLFVLAGGEVALFRFALRVGGWGEVALAVICTQ